MVVALLSLRSFLSWIAGRCAAVKTAVNSSTATLNGGVWLQSSSSKGKAGEADREGRGHRQATMDDKASSPPTMLANRARKPKPNYARGRAGLTILRDALPVRLPLRCRHLRRLVG